MEQIINRNSKWFYIAMIILHLQLVIKNIIPFANITTDHLPIIFLGAMNLYLYIAMLVDCCKRKYIELRKTSVILLISTLILWVVMSIHEIKTFDVAAYTILNSAVQHVLIGWILVTRIQTIDRLVEITERGSGKWK